MAQSFPRFCPSCGAPNEAQQPSCATCGLDLTYRAAQPEQRIHVSGNDPLQTSPFQPAPTQQPVYQTQHYKEPLLSRSTPRKRLTRRMGRMGCVLVLVLVLLALGMGVYFGAPLLGLPISPFGGTTQPPITTTTLNTAIIYAGLDITILNVQQAERFTDDTTPTGPGILRVHVRAQNNTHIPVNLLYTAIARLVLSGGKTLSPSYVSANIGILPGATRESILDFAVPTTTHVEQLTLRLGTPTEAQMDIPLTPYPDLTQYAPKTTTLNDQLHYLGLNWNVVSATSQLSIAGQQARAGMYYVTLAFKVNNMLSQTAIAGSAYDYMRLKVADMTLTPVATTLPVSFAAGAQGQTGTVTFLLSQKATTLTVILLASDQSGFNQATTDIQLS